MKRTAAAMIYLAMFVIACEKQELNSPEINSAATKKQELTITTSPPGNHYFPPTVSFTSNGQFLDEGDVVEDCDYMGLKPSSGN